MYFMLKHKKLQIIFIYSKYEYFAGFNFENNHHKNNSFENESVDCLKLFK